MESLVELDFHRWCELRDSLLTKWPTNVPGYYALWYNIENPSVREAFQFKVYCPYGDIKNGFVATTIKGEEIECIFWITNMNTKDIEKVIANTKVLEWNNKICVDMVSPVVLKGFQNIRSIIDFKMFEAYDLETLFLGKNSEPYENIKLAHNVHITHLKEHDVRQVDDRWPYKHSGSHQYFSVLTRNGLSYGLYSNEDELLAWVFINEFYSIGHLYCMENYRRRGFAESLVKYVVNENLRKGKDLHTQVVQGNEKSMGLFRKLGFTVIENSAYIYLQK